VHSEVTRSEHDQAAEHTLASLFQKGGGDIPIGGGPVSDAVDRLMTPVGAANSRRVECAFWKWLVRMWNVNRDRFSLHTEGLGTCAHCAMGLNRVN